MSEHTLLALASVIVLGVGAQWLAWRIRLPSILLLLITGMVAGPLTGLLDPDLVLGDSLLPIISLSVALILYEGGLSLRVTELYKVGAVVRNLLSVGALVGWFVATLAAYVILGFNVPLAVLLGAILIVTGPTVIGPLLRQIRPAGAVGPILKWEGIAIDPLGALAAVLVFDVVSATEGGNPWLYSSVAVLKTIVAGGGLGFLAAGLLTLLLTRYWVPDHLQNAVSLMMAVAAFAASNHFQQESGLLATTVMGVVLANQKRVAITHIVEFKEDLRVLLIGILFILLAARLKLEDVTRLGPAAIVFVIVLIVVVRPLSVWASTLGSGLTWRERVFLGWMAPRGIVAAAVSSVLALRLEELGYERASELVPATYAVVVGTVAVYGLTAPVLAKKLQVADPDPQGLLIVGAGGWSRVMAVALNSLGYRVLLADTNWQNVTGARMAGLEAYHGNVLADRFFDDVDFGGLGRLLATTPNDGVNMLATERFSKVFGASAVYRLPPPDGGPAYRTPQDVHAHGRLLFGPKISLSTLGERVAAGDVVKVTALTDTFDYSAFRHRYGGSQIPLFVVDPNGKLAVVTADQPAQPAPGDTIVSLVRDDDTGVTGR